MRHFGFIQVGKLMGENDAVCIILVDKGFCEVKTSLHLFSLSIDKRKRISKLELNEINREGKV